MRVRSIRNIEGEMMSDQPSTETLRSATSALTEAEAAQYIGMSAAWLKKSRTKRFRSLIDAPPFIRAGVKRVVYRIEDLDKWQQRHLHYVGPQHEGLRSDEIQSAAEVPAGATSNEQLAPR
jgi:predicted DNA-binding transcriptional regulator AlpA